MKYNVYIEGTFSGIQSIMVEQVYPITIKCSGCNLVHKKDVILSIDSINYTDKDEKVNLKVKCASCTRQMYILIKSMATELYEEKFYCAKKEDNRYLASQLQGRGCYIEKIKDANIHVLSEKGRIYPDIVFDEGYWREEDNMNNTSSIEDFN
ncbi:hypothetical protein SLOPH_1662, partial [Spraguea lophii 42_110]